MLKNFLVKFFFVCEGKDGKCFFYIKCDDKLYMLIVNFYFKILGFVVFLFEFKWVNGYFLDVIRSSDGISM